MRKERTLYLAMNPGQFLVSGSIGEDFGVHISLPIGITIKNQNGDEVPGVVLSIEEAPSTGILVSSHG